MTEYERQKWMLEQAVKQARKINATSGQIERRTAVLRSSIEIEQLRMYGRKLLRKCMGL